MFWFFGFHKSYNEYQFWVSINLKTVVSKGLLRQSKVETVASQGLLRISRSLDCTNRTQKQYCSQWSTVNRKLKTSIVTSQKITKICQKHLVYK